MLGRYLDALDDDARARVLAAPVEKWITGLFFAGSSGRGCLVGHASGWAGGVDGAADSAFGVRLPTTEGYPLFPHNVSHRYDEAMHRIGPARLVPMIHARAASPRPVLTSVEG